MTYNELLTKVAEVFPGAEVAEDNDGQIIIYTGYKGVTDPDSELLDVSQGDSPER